ncbi:MAG: hypothetical protein JO066_15875 [Verrucomicrobia bacterium]|nr:hypothetical protein [Verrucomicrobiota bacterium]
MSTLRILSRQNALIPSISVGLALTLLDSVAQAPYDVAARESLANEINQTYGNLVTPALSIAELFDIKNRLDKADAIAQNYGVDLDYREHSYVELCEFESRIRLALTLNQQYRTNIDWREYGYPQLVQMEEQLKSQSESAKH